MWAGKTRTAKFNTENWERISNRNGKLLRVPHFAFKLLSFAVSLCRSETLEVKEFSVPQKLAKQTRLAISNMQSGVQ